MANNKRTASPADVRTWARENGHTVGTRGRFAPALVKAYNAAHKGAPYVEAAFIETRKVTATVTDKRGRKRPVTRSVSLPEVRKAAAAAGVKVGERGRIGSTVLAAYVSGDWSALTGTASTEATA